MIEVIKKYFFGCFFGIILYKIIELLTHNYPYIGEILGALGGAFMCWVVNLADSLAENYRMNKKSISKT